MEIQCPQNITWEKPCTPPHLVSVNPSSSDKSKINTWKSSRFLKNIFYNFMDSLKTWKISCPIFVRMLADALAQSRVKFPHFQSSSQYWSVGWLGAYLATRHCLNLHEEVTDALTLCSQGDVAVISNTFTLKTTWGLTSSALLWN